MKKSVSIPLMRLMTIAVGTVYFVMSYAALFTAHSIVQPVYATTTLTKNTQADFLSGKYEYGDIDISNSVSPKIQLQADLGSWDASGPANFNHNLNYTSFSTKLLKIGNFLYLFRNRSLGGFYRYDMGTREWKEMSSVPVQPYEVLDATTNAAVGTDSATMIYALATRSGRKHLLQYAIATDTWSVLDQTPNTLGAGGGVEFVPGSPNKLYVIQGGSTAFWSYNLSTNQWTTITSAVTCTTFCDLMYDGSRYLYMATDATNPDNMYRYDTQSGGTWGSAVSIGGDGILTYASDMVKLGTNFYMMRGGGNTTMYKYNGTSWAAVATLPFPVTFGSLAVDTGNNRIIVLAGMSELYYFYPDNGASGSYSYPMNGPPLNAYGAGKMLATNGSGTLFLCRAQATTTCYQYVTSTNTWSALATTGLGALNDGTSLAWYSARLYAVQGGGTGFYNYNAGTWTAGTAAPAAFGAGSALVASGSSSLWALRGAGTQTFWKYVSSWTAMANLPLASGRGTSLVATGNKIYGLVGNSRGRFFRYDETPNTWTELASLPIGSYNGGDMTTDGTYIYATVGGDNDIWGKQFYRYTIASNTWMRLRDVPSMMRYGGSIIYDGGKVYAYEGYGGGFYKYTPPTTTYTQMGTWYSPVYDLTYVSSFGANSFTTTQSTPGTTTINYFSRTSDNQKIWDDWSPIVSGVIGSDTHRYIQIKAELRGDGTATPNVSQFAIAYTGDESAPETAGIVTLGFSQNGGSSLTSGNTYTYHSPYFTWSGVTDTATSVDGYYVYFGTNSTADPAVVGGYQKTSNYSVSTALTNGNTYYLRIKAKDIIGNISSAITAFTYVYQGLDGSTVPLVSTQAGWDSYESSKSAIYTGTTGWWNQSYLYRKQLTVSTTPAIDPGSPILITLDTAALQTAGKVRSDRKDWRVVYWTGNVWQELEQQYVDTTHTYFALQKGIAASSSDTNYYVYYGNANEQSTSRQVGIFSNSNNRWGGSASFDGGDQITLPSITNGLSQFTVEGWFRYYNSSANRYIIGNSTAGNYLSVNVQSGGNQMRYCLRTSGTNYCDTVTTKYLIPGSWNHFAFQYNSTTGTATSYLNGMLDYTHTSITGTVSTTANTERIGVGSVSGTEYFYGNIDEIRYSNVVRYANNFTPPTSAYTSDANTLALYHFDDASGQTLADSSGNGKNGQLGTGAGVDSADPTWITSITASAGTETNVGSDSATSVTLEKNDNGMWAASKVPSAPWGSRMYYGAAVNAGNNVYVLKGNNTTAFHKLNTSTGTWSQMSDIPANAYFGATMTYDGADSIYALRGNTQTSFYKYTLSTDTWSSSVSQPAYTIAYGGSSFYLNGSIYVMRGGNTTDFFRYVIANDSWEPLASVPTNVYYGAGLTDDGNGNLYAVTGNGSGFYKYTIATDTWDSTATAPPFVPYAIGYSSNNLIRYGNYLYTFTSYDYQGNLDNKHFVWRYNLTSGLWSYVDTDTDFWMYFGAVSYDGSRYAYLFQGYNTTTYVGATAVARYDLLTNSFTPGESPMPLDRLYTNDGEQILHQMYTNSAIVTDGNDYLYAAQGGTSYVNKYQISTKKWSMMPFVPCVFNGSLVYANNSLYAVCANTTALMYRYDAVSNGWVKTADAPNTIGTGTAQGAVYDGSAALYVLRGGGTQTIYKYTIATDTWTTETNSIPAAVNNSGASVTYKSGYLYVVGGNSTTNFYRYNIGTPGWTTMTPLPEVVGAGSGSIVDSTNNKIFVMTGNNNVSMYSYDIAMNSWTRAPDMMSHVANGGSITTGPGNSVFVLEGNYTFTLWKYYLPTTSSSYKTTGTYTSKIFDLSAGIQAWGGFDVSMSSPSGTTTQFESRTSPDGSTWSAWSFMSDMKSIGSEYTYSINSPVNRYLQIRATLTSEDGSSGPVINSYSTDVYLDTEAPTNPNTINAYTSATMAASITEGVWNNDIHPYFTWSGAADGYGSGIAGYYVYFGTDSAALASQSGVFQTAANYTATMQTDGSDAGEYYLNIQAKDAAGNIAAANWAAFHLNHIDVTKPTNANTVNGYATSAKATLLNQTQWYNYQHPYFEWSGATDELNGSGIAGYYVYFGTDSAALASQSGVFQTAANYTATMQTDGSDAGEYYLNIQAKDAAGNIASANWSAYHLNHIDSVRPTNPDTLSSYSTSTAGATIITGNFYNYQNPHFTWSGATDELNGSGIAGYYVYFGTNPLADPAVSGQLITNASYSASLITNGYYYLSIKTVDNAGNTSLTSWSPFEYLFDSTPPTQISPENLSSLPSGYSSVNNFSLFWLPTDDPLAGGIASGFQGYYYKTGTSSGALSQWQLFTGSCAGGQCYLPGITAYQEGTNTFYLRTQDNVGNISSVSTLNYYYNSTAPSAPRNLSVDNTQASANKFNFVWDEPSTFRGSIKEYRYSVNEIPNEANISTTSGRLVNNIKGTHDGTNTFYVVAVDDSNNVNYGNYASKDFSVSVTAPGIPLAPEAFDNSIRSTQQYRVGLTWDPPTDKGSSFDRYEIYSSTTEGDCNVDMTSFSKVGSTAGTSYVVTSMGDENLASEKYYFCIVACASTNQCSSPSTTVNMTPTGRWLTAPDMVGTTSATVKTKTATIAWTTSRSANSFVKYGTKSGDYGSEVGSSEQVIAHSIAITELKPGTTYYYKMLWTDEDGNLGSSAERTFTTNAAPAISGVKFTRVNINSADVTFTIQNALKATIQYGKTISYGSTQTISTSKTEATYTVQVAPLLEGTLYHLRIVGEDDEGNIYSGDDYTFETLPTPKLSGIRLQQVVGMPTATVRLIWASNTPINSIVTYYPTQLPQLATDKISLVLKKNHEVILNNLADETEYTILIKGKDAVGNEAKTETRTLKTANDVRPPEVQNLNVESTIIGVGENARAQIVVTWDSDEPSTTQVEYGQGTGSTYNQTTQEDTNKTTNHTVTITGLSPSKIYHLRALSKDKADNLGQSLDTVIITPKSTKDALNLVIDNLSKTFGFLKGATILK